MSSIIQKEEKSRKHPIVLIVDDEEMVTRTLSTYLQLETHYDVYAFQSPQEALKALKKKPVDVIISDFFMPEMNGLQFLSEVKQMYPDATRILLTGYADKENAIKGINEVGLFQYIEKPWDNEQLKLVIRNAIANKNLKLVLESKIKELDQVLLERDELAESNEMLREELLLARNVQESMLPQNYPGYNGISVTAKYLPALEIGGDFYDIITLANNNLAILMADVTGHGIKAALITVLLKSAFSTFADCETDPGEILSYMNKILCKILPKGLFVAAIVTTIDTKSALCRISNGGVPHPFLLRVENGTVERIPANGLLLGVAQEDLFTPGKEVTIQLQKGDRLILFTDGLSETENECEEQFENEYLLDTLTNFSHKRSDEILEELVQAAKKFSKPEHKWDDITILGIESN